MTATERQTVQALLAWYEAMGVDEAIGERPIDRFGPPKQDWGETIPTTKLAASPAKSAADASSVSARNATTLEELQALVAAFDGCALKRTAKNLCFARGSARASLMLIGEAPGRDEDLQGRPFVGRAGQMLDLMLAAIGLGEEHVYITNTVYWRPPGNRTPTQEEVEACAPFLARQIELLSPQVLVLLGGAAAKNILGITEGIMRLRGKWLSYRCGGHEIATLATLHPAFLLRNPEQKRLAWRDMLMIKERLSAL